MFHTCRQCRTEFDVTDDDLAFYDQVSPVFQAVKQTIPPPTLCPDCRLQRRVVFRNQIFVYQRPSSITGRQIFSRFSPDVPFPVVENEYWYGGAWNALQFGQTYDLSVSFFEQIRAVRDRVPHRSLSLTQVENCDYCNNALSIKNCYLVFNSTSTEDCMYCENCAHSKDCIDSSYCPTSQLCYDCTMCVQCYNVQSSEFCENCSESMFLSHCVSCRDCLGCINLSHKQYCAFNVQYTVEEYRAILAQCDMQSWSSRRRIQQRCAELWMDHPRPHCTVVNSDNVRGNHIINSRNVQDSFLIQSGEDLRFCLSFYDTVKTSYDFSYFGKNCELMYEDVSCGINDSHVLFSFDCWGSNSNLLYCWMCEGCEDCFGCVGLQKKRHCILNVQYEKDDYERLVTLIIERMRAEGSWGEFFPMSLSPFPYNHTIAQRYFPLAEDTVGAVGCYWYKREVEDEKKAVAADALPDGLPSIDEPITVRSAQSGRTFRITSQEIKRYRQISAPLPRITYDERMEARAAILGGVRLYERPCAKTGTILHTTYPPDTPFPVWDRVEYVREFRG